MVVLLLGGEHLEVVLPEVDHLHLAVIQEERLDHRQDQTLSSVHPHPHPLGVGVVYRSAAPLEVLLGVLQEEQLVPYPK